MTDSGRFKRCHLSGKMLNIHACPELYIWGGISFLGIFGFVDGRPWVFNIVIIIVITIMFVGLAICIIKGSSRAVISFWYD